MIPLYVGFDPREAAAYHVFCQSVLNRSSVPIAFIPLHRPLLSNFDGQRDGSNAFIYSRYLIPYLSGYSGWAAFMDGDMVLRADLAELWALRDEKYAVQVVKHEYKTKHKRKYIGSPIENDNVDYERKNWSSVMLMNCGHHSNRILTKELVRDMGGSFLHRFQWLTDEEIGALPKEWNHLVGEYPPADAKLVHYTLGIPAFGHYGNCEHSGEWHKTAEDAFYVIGEMDG